MTETLYWKFLLILYGVILFMGFDLIFGVISKELRGSTYHAARKSAGYALIVSPIVGIIFYLFRFFNYSQPYIVTAVNLTSYYISIIFMTIAFLLVIGHKKDELRQTAKILHSTILLFLCPTWLPIWFGDIKTIRICHIIAYTILVLAVIILAIYLFVIFKRAKKRINEYYSDDIVRHINWVSRSIRLIMGLIVVALISPFSKEYSLWLVFFYAIYQFVVYYYIFESVQRFELTSLTLSSSADEKDNEVIPSIDINNGHNLSDETMELIAKGLNNWIKEAGYAANGITVKSVASQIYTNRTYLSSYINKTYGCSFNVWINKLRIDSAKLFLCSNTEYSLEEIAKKLGYSSTSSFVSNFVKIENITPQEWRKEHKNVTG